MQLILTNEPTSQEQKRAFEALDDVFGAEAFDDSEAKKLLSEHGFNSQMLKQLVDNGSISEVH